MLPSLWNYNLFFLFLATDSFDALPAPAEEEAKSTDKDTKDRLEL